MYAFVDSGNIHEPWGFLTLSFGMLSTCTIDVFVVQNTTTHTTSKKVVFAISHRKEYHSFSWV